MEKPQTGDLNPDAGETGIEAAMVAQVVPACPRTPHRIVISWTSPGYEPDDARAIVVLDGAPVYKGNDVVKARSIFDHYVALDEAEALR